MPEIKLVVNEDRAEEIDALLALSDEAWAELQRFISKPFGNDFRDRLEDPAIRAVVSLRRFADGRDAKPQDVVEGLEDGLKRFGWDEGKMKAFRKLKPRLTNVLNEENLSLTQRILRQYYDVLIHLHDAKISTELKPIFSNDNSKIDSLIVYNILKLSYSDGYENQRELEIHLELEEIKKLRQACDEALQRSQVTKSQMHQKLNVNVIIHADSPSENEQAE